MPQYRVVVYPALCIIDASGYSSIRARMCFRIGTSTNENHCPLGVMTFNANEPTAPTTLLLGPGGNATDPAYPRVSTSTGNTYGIGLHIMFSGFMGGTDSPIATVIIGEIGREPGIIHEYTLNSAGPIIYSIFCWREVHC